jgi:predicted glycoside hydrolase/deacetylase ChbG (UPF0249 family)
LATRVIINADDLGLSPGVNDAVFGLMSRGRVTSATIMANGPALRDAAARSRQFPRCSFGVHMNLTDLPPLTGNKDLAPLLGDDGSFARKARDVPITPTIADAIRLEWCAQIDRVRSLGVPISHLDSHHHIHTHAPLFSILKSVQSYSGITRVRTTMNLYDPADPPRGGRTMLLKKRLWDLALRWRPPRARTSRLFTSFLIYHNLLPAVPRAGLVELMTHPGSPNPEFQREERLLETPWESRSTVPIRLISYNDI